jgi:regulator of cell morphogenesis and NO signaling
MKITKENTVAETLAQNMGSDQVFSKYKIDFCCGGGVTLEVACKESNVEFEVLKKEIETISNKISNI